MVIVNGDLLAVSEGVIVHQVNCQGKMGAGIAKAIKNKWLIVYEKYMGAYAAKKWQLGKIQIVQISDKLYVCNLAGQDRYGRDKRYTDYDAVTRGFVTLKNWCLQSGTTKVHIPYKMGCVNAGGDWNEYQEAIRKSGIEDAEPELVAKKITVIIHKLEGVE